ncbi:hypothetical protein A3F66_01925 [candidate division TM6 bacterium RIFCSPHIGHO2_12_FULL_32_22]|nr:MAG: hypothetical protein A3F66_01925 [candidate division TM6 bacterium RIFCSPHIGHO2_12_FULL_32_22]
MKKFLLFVAFAVLSQTNCVTRSTAKEPNINAIVQKIYGTETGKKIIELQKKVQSLESKQDKDFNDLLTILEKNQKALDLFLDYTEKNAERVDTDRKLNKLLAPKLEEFQDAILGKS